MLVTELLGQERRADVVGVLVPPFGVSDVAFLEAREDVEVVLKPTLVRIIHLSDGVVFPRFGGAGNGIQNLLAFYNLLVKPL